MNYFFPWSLDEAGNKLFSEFVNSNLKTSIQSQNKNIDCTCQFANIESREEDWLYTEIQDIRSAEFLV